MQQTQNAMTKRGHLEMQKRKEANYNLIKKDLYRQFENERLD